MELNVAIGADCARLTFGVPLPGTSYTHYGVEIGVLDPRAAKRLPYITDIAKNSPQPIFKTPYKKELINLYYLFHLGVTHPKMLPLIKKLVFCPVTHLLRYHMLLTEKKYLISVGLMVSDTTSMWDLRTDALQTLSV